MFHESMSNLINALDLHVQIVHFSKERIYETLPNQRNEFRSVAMETKGSKCCHGYIFAQDSMLITENSADVDPYLPYV